VPTSAISAISILPRWYGRQIAFGIQTRRSSEQPGGRNIRSDRADGRHHIAKRHVDQAGKGLQAIVASEVQAKVPVLDDDVHDDRVIN
jgi:hypothetical protein